MNSNVWKKDVVTNSVVLGVGKKTRASPCSDVHYSLYNHKIQPSCIHTFQIIYKDTKMKPFTISNYHVYWSGFFVTLVESIQLGVP